MNPITRLARARIDPSKRADLMEAYATYSRAVADDDDVLAWQLCSEAADENLIWIIATFPDADAHARHMADPATAAVLPTLEAALVDPPTLSELVQHQSTHPG